MDSFDSYLLRKLYKEIQKHGDKLAETEKHVDWNAYHSLRLNFYSFIIRYIFKWGSRGIRILGSLN